MKNLKKENNFDLLLGNIYQAHSALQDGVVRIVNRFLTLRNWLVGYYVVEYEQNGADRAKYGEKLLEEIASKLRERDPLCRQRRCTCGVRHRRNERYVCVKIYAATFQQKSTGRFYTKK